MSRPPVGSRPPPSGWAHRPAAAARARACHRDLLRTSRRRSPGSAPSSAPRARAARHAGKTRRTGSPARIVTGRCGSTTVRCCPPPSSRRAAQSPRGLAGAGQSQPARWTPDGGCETARTARIAPRVLHVLAAFRRFGAEGADTPFAAAGRDWSSRTLLLLTVLKVGPAWLRPMILNSASGADLPAVQGYQQLLLYREPQIYSSHHLGCVESIRVADKALFIK